MTGKRLRTEIADALATGLTVAGIVLMAALALGSLSALLHHG